MKALPQEKMTRKTFFKRLLGFSILGLMLPKMFQFFSASKVGDEEEMPIKLTQAPKTVQFKNLS